MNTTEQLVKQAERLQARVEFLQQALHQLHVEVRAHGDVLRHQLNGAAPSVPSAAALAAAPVALPVQAIPIAVPAATGAERRCLPRRPVNQVLIELASITDESETFSGWIVDFNMVGLGIWVEKRVPTGTFVTVRPLKAVANCKWKEAQVKNCQRDQEGWRLGCKLEEQLTPDDLRMLGLE